MERAREWVVPSGRVEEWDRLVVVVRKDMLVSCASWIGGLGVVIGRLLQFPSAKSKLGQYRGLV